MTSGSERARTWAWTAMRVATGILFFSHGGQKMFGWFGGFGGPGETAEFLTRFGVAGVLEVLGGALVAVGLFTRPAAFVVAGEMAVAYFWIHAGGGGLWWWANRGELPVLYCFNFLLLAAWGAGPFSLDALLRPRRPRAEAPAPSGADAPSR
jgi:putative oxidoreductase